jgi:hypothetical protein
LSVNESKTPLFLTKFFSRAIRIADQKWRQHVQRYAILERRSKGLIDEDEEESIQSAYLARLAKLPNNFTTPAKVPLGKQDRSSSITFQSPASSGGLKRTGSAERLDDMRRKRAARALDSDDSEDEEQNVGMGSRKASMGSKKNSIIDLIKEKFGSKEKI